VNNNCPISDSFKNGNPYNTLIFNTLKNWNENEYQKAERNGQDTPIADGKLRRQMAAEK